MKKISNKLKSVFKNDKLIIQNVEESCSQCHGNDVIKLWVILIEH